MSEQKQEQGKAADVAKLDATAAAAALALAVKTAEQASGTMTGPAAGKPNPTSRDTARSLAAWPDLYRAAAVIAVVIGLGSAAGLHGIAGGKAAPPGSAHMLEAALESIRRNNEDIAHVTRDVRALTAVVDGIKESLDQGKIEAKDRTNTIARLVEASERIERASADAGAKLAAMGARLDAVERQATSAFAAAKAAIPTDGPHTGSVPDAKIGKHLPLEGWVLHDVHRGVALVESRNGRLHEVVVGQKLPTVGRVEAIERRGRSWVVVTAKGIISTPRAWR